SRGKRKQSSRRVSRTETRRRTRMNTRTGNVLAVRVSIRSDGGSRAAKRPDPSNLISVRLRVSVSSFRTVIFRHLRDLERMITLTLKEPPSVPLEAEMLSPDAIAPLTIEEIRALPVYLGKRQRRVDDFFSVEGEP